METALSVKQRLAARLRELRAAKGWTQERLAEEASMHRTYLAGIESSIRNPSLENLVKLANALGVPIIQLFLAESQPAGSISAGNPDASRKAKRNTSPK